MAESTSDAFAAFFTDCRTRPPVLALILGSGLGRVAETIEVEREIPFSHVPGLTDVSVAGHRGRLLLGHLAEKRILIFQGRLHRYEGCSWEQVEAPVRVAVMLGSRCLLVTNSAGGIRDGFTSGTLMAIRDHLDLTRPYFWRELLAQERVERHRYDVRLTEQLRAAGEAVGVRLETGVYASVTGPCYETPAEIRALRSLGADAVGMSTAREVAAAWRLGVRVVGLSCITNPAAGLSPTPLNHDEVLAAARRQEASVQRLIQAFVSRFEV